MGWPLQILYGCSKDVCWAQWGGWKPVRARDWTSVRTARIGDSVHGNGDLHAQTGKRGGFFSVLCDPHHTAVFVKKM